MGKKHIVDKTILLNAPVSKVWDALTDPEISRKYFFNARVLSNWKRGSSIVFEGRMLWIIPFRMEGKILEIEPAKLLKYELKNGKTGTSSVVTDHLTEKDGGTELHVTDDVGAGDGYEKRYKRSMKGWDKILTGLKSVVER